MVIPWPIWDQKLQITWGLAAKKKYDHRRFSIFTFLAFRALLRPLGENGAADYRH